MKGEDAEATFFDLSTEIPERELRLIQTKAMIDVVLGVYQAIEGHPFQGNLSPLYALLGTSQDVPSGYLHQQPISRSLEMLSLILGLML